MSASQWDFYVGGLGRGLSTKLKSDGFWANAGEAKTIATTSNLKTCVIPAACYIKAASATIYASDTGPKSGIDQVSPSDVAEHASGWTLFRGPEKANNYLMGSWT
jgi:hypothetical protein